MNWREAFLQQARSDEAVRQLVNRADVAYSHRLHYLQMVCEKLAKGYLSSSDGLTRPEHSHYMLVTFLRVLPGRPEIREALGYERVQPFAALIRRVLPLAAQIEQLVPELTATRPNAEYPWKPPGRHDVYTPCEYDFEALDPASSLMAQFDKLLRSLLRILDKDVL